jgi:hypothetical protein
MKDVNTCAAKDCDKPRFLDYYVCAEHFAFYAAPHYTDSMLVKVANAEPAPYPDFCSTPKLPPASPPSRNPRRPIQHSLKPQSALEHTEPSLRCSYRWPLAGVFAFPLSWGLSNWRAT